MNKTKSLLSRDIYERQVIIRAKGKNKEGQWEQRVMRGVHARVCSSLHRAARESTFEKVTSEKRP